MMTALLPLLAVHIDDGYLTLPWLAGGFAVAGLLALLGAWRIRDEEVPRVALMTAAFFVASLMHVSVGPTSVHLLFNGLVGVVLGRRACLAIPVGLFLQAALFHHGGFTTLGVNSVVMTLPALLAWGLFAGLQRVRWLRHPWFRAGLVAVSALAWTLSLVFSVALLCTNRLTQLDHLDVVPALRLTFHPLTLVAAALLAGAAVWLERRLENRPEFPLGLLLGEVAVLATICLNSVVLLYGGQEDWHALALGALIAHLPIAVIEGVVLGFTVGFLVRVKPGMLRWRGAEDDHALETDTPAVACAALESAGDNGHGGERAGAPAGG
jgi:cobalt/nickel transport system permease protein